MDGKYIAGGRTVRKQPTETATGFKMGFFVCNLCGGVADEGAQEIADALNLYEAMRPRPIKEAPSLERIIAIGWQAASGNVQGYWWRQEDVTDENGTPTGEPSATHFIPLDALPLPQVGPDRIE